MVKKKNYGRSKKAADEKSPIVDATTQNKIFKKNVKLPKTHTSDSPPSLKTAKANLKKIERVLAELNLSEANKMTVEMGLQQAEQHMNLEEISQQRIAKAIKQVLEALQGEEEFEAAKQKLVTPVKTVARWLGNNWLHILELLEEE